MNTKGISVDYKFSNTTNSVYLKLDGSLLKALRIADHSVKGNNIFREIIICDTSMSMCKRDLKTGEISWYLTKEKEGEVIAHIMKEILGDRKLKKNLLGERAYNKSKESNKRTIKESGYKRF